MRVRRAWWADSSPTLPAKKRLSYERLTKMNMLKTGALIRASCLLGCIAAGAGAKERAAAELFAERLGLAFQLTDDLLDMGTEDNKTTYLTYLTPEEAQSYAKKLTDEAAAAVAEYDRDGVMRDFCEFIRRQRQINYTIWTTHMDIFNNNPLICASAGLGSAQLIKFIIVEHSRAQD